jgi:Protein of unknown function (DUF1566)
MKQFVFFSILLTGIGLLSQALAAELPRTGQRTCYDQAGYIVDHTDTGQDGDHQAGTVWPEPRFTDNGDGTVSDHLTGLMWLQSGDCLGDMTWTAALTAIASLNASEMKGKCLNLSTVYDDWLLPEIGQLETLFHSEKPSPHTWLNQWAFEDILADFYWSKTTSPNPYKTWAFRFNTGEVATSAKVERHHVILVRKPPPSDAAGIQDTSLPAAVKKSNPFIDNKDGTITDTATGLMWLQDGNCLSPSDWQTALGQVMKLNNAPGSYECRNLTTAYDDWALPNRNEFRSLIDHSADLPALVTDHPFLNIRPLYWSSTSSAQHPAKAFDLHMGSGDLRLSSKVTQRNIWPVRPAAGRSSRNRVEDMTESLVMRKVHFQAKSTGSLIKISWPPKRFNDYGDGTLLDTTTGLMWLKDGSCLGKQTWDYAFVLIDRLNENKRRMDCREYSASYNNWQLPDLATLSQLAGTGREETATWLNNNGTVNISARDYWTSGETLLNLYHAYSMNLKHGTPRTYSKEFLFHVWPVRVPDYTGVVNPTLTIKGNNTTDMMTLHKGEKLSLSVGVTSAKTTVPGNYRIWYDSPDGSIWWLTANNEWLTEDTILYNGIIFEMNDYSVFNLNTTGMAAGHYFFNFSISAESDDDSGETIFTSEFHLNLVDVVNPLQLDRIGYQNKLGKSSKESTKSTESTD